MSPSQSPPKRSCYLFWWWQQISLHTHQRTELCPALHGTVKDEPFNVAQALIKHGASKRFQTSEVGVTLSFRRSAELMIFGSSTLKGASDTKTQKRLLLPRPKQFGRLIVQLKGNFWNAHSKTPDFETTDDESHEDLRQGDPQPRVPWFLSPVASV